MKKNKFAQGGYIPKRDGGEFEIPLKNHYGDCPIITDWHSVLEGIQNLSNEIRRQELQIKNHLNSTW